MKILLVGPYPPPHGGISVHVYELRKQLHMAGIDCRVVNVDPRCLESADYLCIRGGASLLLTLIRYARRGWTLHVHANGHNRKSWLIALTAGVAGLFGPGNVLTLHSGLVPEYLASQRFAARSLARMACGFYKRIIAVSPPVRDAVLSLGILARRVAVVPAFLAPRVAKGEGMAVDRLQGRSPILATAVFFRPEYGFDLLVEAIDQLRVRYPQIACLVIGSGERQEYAEMLVRRRGLQQSIIFLGNVDHEKCLSLISQADLFVRPTLVDGDASSVREALAMGTRVVASDAGYRPPGVVLFRKGDAVDLAAKIEEVWLRPVPTPAACDALQDDAVGTLIGLYESLTRSLTRSRRKEDHGQTQPIAENANW